MAQPYQYHDELDYRLLDYLPLNDRQAIAAWLGMLRGLKAAAGGIMTDLRSAPATRFRHDMASRIEAMIEEAEEALHSPEADLTQIAAE